MKAVKSVALGILALSFAASTGEAAPVRRWRPVQYWKQVYSQMFANTDDGDDDSATPAVAPAAPAPVAAPSATPTTITTMSAPANSTTVAALLGQSTTTADSASATATTAADPAYSPLSRWGNQIQVNSGASYTAPTYNYDAFVNFGNSAYASADQLTTGGATAWYNSPVVQKLYGGTPTEAQRAEFSQTVMERVQETYAKSGVPISLTTDPTASAAHSLSLVSGTSFSGNADAAGIASMGGDGFSFIDHLSYAKSTDELEWVVAHNIAHELMHTFNVDHHDATGAFLDGPVASWELLAAADTVFSPAAVSDLLSKDFKARYLAGGAKSIYGAEELDAAMISSPVPEPATILIWSLAGCGLWAARRRLRNRALAA